MLILIFWQGGVEVCHVVTKHKFPVCSEAKHHQNVMLEFGAEKGLLQGHAKRQVADAPQSPNCLKDYSKSFKDQVKEGWSQGT